jgi:hypothetical protein
MQLAHLFSFAATKIASALPFFGPTQLQLEASPSQFMPLPSYSAQHITAKVL